MGICNCGCGGQTKNRFMPGHDQREKGRLLRIIREVNSTESDRIQAVTNMRLNGWDNALYPGIQRTFGVELEVISPVSSSEIEREFDRVGIVSRDAYRSTIHSGWWKITRDASIIPPRDKQGFEIVSPVLFGTEGFRQLRKVCEVLTKLGCSVNKTCGLHVHHAAHDMTLEQTKRLIRNYSTATPWIMSWMPESRRYSNFCTPYDHHALERIENATNLKTISQNMSRYMALSIAPYTSKGTFEFRQHAGTINFEKIRNWVLFGQRLMALSREDKQFSLDHFDEKAQKHYAARIEKKLAAAA